MISFAEYFGPWINHPDATEERKANAIRLLTACDLLERMAVADGVVFPEHDRSLSGLAWHDHSDISGVGFGGFRPQFCPIGASHSAHKEALAVDRFDPSGLIDAWCMKNQDKLAQCGIYLEHPSATSGWSHWGVRPPASGKQVYFP